MTEFNALLKRSFAEAHEPADDGFSVRCRAAWRAGRLALKSRFGLQMGALGIAVAAVAYGLWSSSAAWPRIWRLRLALNSPAPMAR